MELIKTGIDGLDKLLRGGIPKGWITILSGEPGSGKTCLSVGFLVEGIRKFNESGIYCSFNESRKELLLTQKAFGYDLEEYEKQGKFAILDLSHGRASGEGQLSFQQKRLTFLS